jgi:hypothetical protein
VVVVVHRSQCAARPLRSQAERAVVYS